MKRARFIKVMDKAIELINNRDMFYSCYAINKAYGILEPEVDDCEITGFYTRTMSKGGGRLFVWDAESLDKSFEVSRAILLTTFKEYYLTYGLYKEI